MHTLEQLELESAYAALPAELHAPARPTALVGPLRLVTFDPEVAAMIGLDPAQARRPELLELLGGERLPERARPVAMRYAGHRFGCYEPELGDGRAVLLGEVRDAHGRPWDLHLKGCGPTPLSRGMDGRAVLRAAIREYLGSGAMHALGVPTTRSLCIVAGEEQVERETWEHAAMLLRVAPTHVRFGSFEALHHRGDRANLERLADHVIARHFPHLHARPDRHAALLAEVVQRSASLVAAWQAIGWIHGGLNTDNMSILGLTLDYDGPFGFLDAYDLDRVCCRSDRHGRFAFGRQPAAMRWNLEVLGRALWPLCSEPDVAAALDAFEPTFSSAYLGRMRGKLGLATAEPDDAALVAELLALAAAERVDYPGLFRALGELRRDADDVAEPVRERFWNRAGIDAWIAAYRTRLRREHRDDRERRAAMMRTNPCYVLRDHLLHVAVQSADHDRDFSEIERLSAVLRDPYTERPGMERYAEPPPPWAQGLIVSSSS